MRTIQWDTTSTFKIIFYDTLTTTLLGVGRKKWIGQKLKLMISFKQTFITILMSDNS